MNVHALKVCLTKFCEAFNLDESKTGVFIGPRGDEGDRKVDEVSMVFWPDNSSINSHGLIDPRDPDAPPMDAFDDPEAAAQDWAWIRLSGYEQNTGQEEE